MFQPPPRKKLGQTWPSGGLHLAWRVYLQRLDLTRPIGPGLLWCVSKGQGGGEHGSAWLRTRRRWNGHQFAGEHWVRDPGGQDNAKSICENCYENYQELWWEGY